MRAGKGAWGQSLGVDDIPHSFHIIASSTGWLVLHVGSQISNHSVLLLAIVVKPFDLLAKLTDLISELTDLTEKADDLLAEFLNGDGHCDTERQRASERPWIRLADPTNAPLPR